MNLALFRRADGFVRFNGRKQFSPPLTTTAAAVQFLRDLCALYNHTADLALPPDRRPSNDVTLSGLK